MFKRILSIFILILSFDCFSDIRFKQECVGYYKLILPEQIEIALRDLNRKNDQDFLFVDRKIAYDSNLGYGGPLYISWSGMTKARFIERQNDDLTFINKRFGEDSYIYQSINDGYTRYSNRYYLVRFLRSSREFSFFSNFNYTKINDSINYYKQEAENLIKNFHARELFEIPDKVGSCIPYGFVNNNGENFYRSFGVTYRLLDHPDITIFFEESNFVEGEPKYSSAKEAVENFWNHSNEFGVKRHRPIGTPKFKTIEMAGRKGTGMFVEIQYEDGRPHNYGYYSEVMGDPKAKADTPWLRFYVIGNQEEANGKTPLTKDEIYALAKKIEASITRRVVSE